MRKLKNIFFSIIESFIRNIGGGLGRRIRYAYYKRRLGACGKNVNIDIGVVIDNPSNVFIGDDVWIDNYVILLADKFNENSKIYRKENLSYLFNEGELHIQNGVHIGAFCLIQCAGGVFIGSNTGITSGSKIYSGSHHYRNLLDRSDKQDYMFTTMADSQKQMLICSPVFIGSACAIGLNSVVLPGTTIPDGTWLGAQALVQGQDIKPNAIYTAGLAKFHKYKR